jgi:hypothetical protein
MANQNFEIQHKFKYNGNTYNLSITSEALENSNKVMTSGGVYALMKALAAFVDKKLATEIKNNVSDIPTANAVFNFKTNVIETTKSSSLAREDVQDLKKDDCVYIHKYNDTWRPFIVNSSGNPLVTYIKFT